MAASYTYRKRRREMVLRRCAAMRAGKERKRLEVGEPWRDAGGFRTDGCLGCHEVRLMARDGECVLAVVVDGRHRRARSLNGVKRVLADVLWKRMQG